MHEGLTFGEKESALGRESLKSDSVTAGEY